MENKRGVALATHYIIIATVAIFSIIVLIFFLVKLNLGGKTDQQVCYQSILARSNLNLGPFDIGKKTVALNCKTEKICTSASGENCDAAGFGEPSRKNKITEIKIGKNDNAEEVVLDTISNSLYDCHDVLGGGRLEFMPNTFYSKNYCLVCSRIVLDEEAREKVGKISYPALYSYLENKKIPGGENYLKYLYGIESATEMNIYLEGLREAANERGQNFGSIEDIQLDFGERNGYAVIAQRSPYGTWNRWLQATTTAIVTVAGVVLVPFTGGGSLAVLAIVATGGSIEGVIFFNDFPSGGDYLPPTLYKYDAESLKKIGCTNFEFAP